MCCRTSGATPDDDTAGGEVRYFPSRTADECHPCATALQASIGPLPDGAVTVSHPIMAMVPRPVRKACSCTSDEFCDLCDYGRWSRANGVDVDALLRPPDAPPEDP